MNNDIKPIDTIYKGYRFRSRLEARWAVFLDACGADWEYEAEGFDLGDGVFYLPDFVIQKVKVYQGYEEYYIHDLFIEVKGKMTDADEQKIKKFVGCGTPKQRERLLVVGRIPDGTSMDEICESIHDVAYEGLEFMFNFCTVCSDQFAAHPGVDENGEFALFGDGKHYLDHMDEARTLRAYLMARQARFEHGENG